MGETSCDGCCKLAVVGWTTDKDVVAVLGVLMMLIVLGALGAI